MDLEFKYDNGYYVCTYAGLKSGAIQLIFDEMAQVEFFGDAGLNMFDSLSSSEGGVCIYKTKHLLKYLNMTGLKQVKIRCTKEPLKAIINTDSLL
jgi:hypothetical protein